MKKSVFIIFYLFVCCNTLFCQTWQTSGSNLFLYPTTSNLGIGTNSPSYKLHVDNGILKIGNGSNATSRALNMLLIGDGNYIQIGEWEADNMLSFRASKYNFNNGNVGIGIVPTSKLHVNGDIKGKSFISDNIGPYAYGYLVNATNDVAKTFCVYNSIGIKEVFCVWGNGVVNAKKIYAEAFEVRPDAMTISWFDNVFSESYKLKSLAEIESYVKTYKHLPDIPSEQEIKTEGFNMAQMDALLLKKIEELTLYIIQQQKEIDSLKQQLNK